MKGLITKMSTGYIFKQTLKSGAHLTVYPVSVPGKLYINQSESLQEAQQTLKDLGFSFFKFASSIQDFETGEFASKVLEVWSKEQ